MNKLRVVELFAGIGAQASALERLGIPYTSTVCEINRQAYEVYCAIHGDTPNLWDITKVEHLPECDLLTYSPPCQDISIAGCQRGLKEGSGTRSSLFWEVLRLLKDCKSRGALPPVLVMENVDAITNIENMPHLNRFIIELNGLGYDSSWTIMNSKDYGVPQNRARFFMVSTLDMGHFVFPDPVPLNKWLMDLLETDVPESYYLTEEQVASFERHARNQSMKGYGFGIVPIDPERESKPYRVNPSQQILREYHIGFSEGSRERGLIEIGLVKWFHYEESQRVYSPYGLAPTVTTKGGGMIEL